jgi:hypothetical protein
MQSIDMFLNALKQTYACPITYEIVEDPSNATRPTQIGVLVLKGISDYEVCDMIIDDLGGLRAWPIAATGGKHNASEADPFWVYQTPISEPAVIFSFIEREG